MYFDSSNNVSMHHKVETAAWLGATNGPENVITQPLMRPEVWAAVARIMVVLLAFMFCEKIIHISFLDFEEVFISTMR